MQSKPLALIIVQTSLKSKLLVFSARVSVHSECLRRVAFMTVHNRLTASVAFPAPLTIGVIALAMKYQSASLLLMIDGS